MSRSTMMRKLNLVGIVCFATLAWGSDVLVKEWETPQVLKTPESVLFHDGILYVANIQGLPTDKDGQGFISQVSMQGKIIELVWAKGLHAPKGMGVVGRHLLVTDIDRVVKIDLKTAATVGEFPVADAEFLNDIAVDDEGRVFISDMATSRIHCIEDGELSEWLVLDQEGANGLYVLDSFLFVGTRGALLRIGLDDKKVDVWVDGIASIDGVQPCGDGAFLVSDWRSKIFRIHPDRDPELLSDTGDIGMNAADIEFVADRRLLLVPTFFDNRVIAYRLEK